MTKFQELLSQNTIMVNINLASPSRKHWRAHSFHDQDSTIIHQKNRIYETASIKASLPPFPSCPSRVPDVQSTT
jgi:hypothetical protein